MKVTVYIATTLDGFIARQDGGLDWLPGSDGESAALDEDYGYADLMASVDALIMGRNTFEMVYGFGQWSYGDKPVFVASQSLSVLPDDLPSCVQLCSGTPAELVKKMKGLGHQHLYVDGGKTIQAFLRDGLVTELILTRVPVLIGGGIPLFGTLNQDIPFQHVRTQSYPSGLVLSHYRNVLSDADA